MDQENKTVKQHIEELLRTVWTQRDNPNALSEISIKLATLLYLHNAETSRAELEETRQLVGIIDSANDQGKRMAVAEAERRAILATGNLHAELKSQGEAIVETIQSLKKRLDLLSREFRQS